MSLYPTLFRLFAQRGMTLPHSTIKAQLKCSLVKSPANLQVRINCFFPVLPQPFAQAFIRAFRPFYSVSGLSSLGARYVTYFFLKSWIGGYLRRNSVTVLLISLVHCQGAGPYHYFCFSILIS